MERSMLIPTLSRIITMTCGLKPLCFFYFGQGFAGINILWQTREQTSRLMEFTVGDVGRIVNSNFSCLYSHLLHTFLDEVLIYGLHELQSIKIIIDYNTICNRRQIANEIK